MCSMKIFRFFCLVEFLVCLLNVRCNEPMPSVALSGMRKRNKFGTYNNTDRRRIIFHLFFSVSNKISTIFDFDNDVTPADFRRNVEWWFVSSLSQRRRFYEWNVSEMNDSITDQSMMWIWKSIPVSSHSIVSKLVFAELNRVFLQFHYFLRIAVCWIHCNWNFTGWFSDNIMKLYKNIAANFHAMMI